MTPEQFIKHMNEPTIEEVEAAEQACEAHNRELILLITDVQLTRIVRLLLDRKQEDQAAWVYFREYIRRKRKEGE